MGVEKAGAARGQPIQMRRLRQGVAAQVADPVVLVVDGDEQDVRSCGRGGREGLGEAEKGDQQDGDLHGRGRAGERLLQAGLSAEEAERKG